jgi:hypothetical protein
VALLVELADLVDEGPVHLEEGGGAVGGHPAVDGEGQDGVEGLVVEAVVLLVGARGPEPGGRCGLDDAVGDADVAGELVDLGLVEVEDRLEVDGGVAVGVEVAGEPLAADAGAADDAVGAEAGYVLDEGAYPDRRDVGQGRAERVGPLGLEGPSGGRRRRRRRRWGRPRRRRGRCPGPWRRAWRRSRPPRRWPRWGLSSPWTFSGLRASAARWAYQGAVDAAGDPDDGGLELHLDSEAPQRPGDLLLEEAGDPLDLAVELVLREREVRGVGGGPDGAVGVGKLGIRHGNASHPCAAGKR